MLPLIERPEPLRSQFAPLLTLFATGLPRGTPRSPAGALPFLVGY
jgi:hypothetical protein